MKKNFKFATREQNAILLEKVDDLLKGIKVSTRIETVIAYLYSGKKLPFILSEDEEVELLDTIKSIANTEVAFSILKNYIESYDVETWDYFFASSRSSAFDLHHELERSLSTSKSEEKLFFIISKEIQKTFNTLENEAILEFSAMNLDYIELLEKELLEEIRLYRNYQKQKAGKKVLDEMHKDIYFGIKELLKILDKEKVTSSGDIQKIAAFMKKEARLNEPNLVDIIVNFIESKPLKTKNGYC